MGAAQNEVLCIREAGDHSARRAIPSVAAPDAGADRHAHATFYRWYDLYQTGGPEALEDRSPRPGRVWHRIPDDVRDRIGQLALDEPELSPRELAVQFTDAARPSNIGACSIANPPHGMTNRMRQSLP
jgi:hypothetical protein